MATNQAKQKWQMYVKRGGDHYACCDHCGKKLYGKCEKHELIPRSKSTPDATSYDLLLVEELSSLLCVDCHQHWHSGNSAPTPTQMRDVLFRKNIEFYGREAVQAALDALKGDLNYVLDIELPED